MNNDRILWIDWVKFLGIFGVIGIHITSPLLSANYLFSSEWYQGVIAGSIFRFGVILFIMASGFLILRRKQTINDIPRRVKRVILPFIFWLIVYAIIKVVFLKELGPTWNFNDLLGFIYRGLLDPTIISVQFWYVYMILGLYVISPIMSSWIQTVSIKEIEYYIWIWIIISLLQFLNVHSLLFDYFRYFTGAIGYFILGYYLKIKDEPLYRNIGFGTILFIIGSLITIIGTITVSFATHNQSLLFIKLGDLTPGACLQGIGLFIVVSNTNFDGLNKRINNFVVRVSKNSYGIYLSNILVVNLLEMLNLVYLKGFTLFSIIIYTFIVLFISNLMIEIMDSNPILRQFSGKR